MSLPYAIWKNIKKDGFVKSPFAALRGILRHCGVAMSTPHSSEFARLATEAFYCAVQTLTSCKIIRKGRALFLLFALAAFLRPFPACTASAQPFSLIRDSKVSGNIWARGAEDLRHDEPYEDTRTFRNKLFLEGKAQIEEHIRIFASVMSDYLWFRNDGSRDDFSTELYEGYIEFSEQKWDLRAGNQIVRWGKADEISPVDNLNSQDLRESITLRLEDRKLPVFMLRARYFLPEGTIEGIYKPHFRSAKTDFFGSDWATLKHLKTQVRRSTTLSQALKDYLTGLEIREKEYSTGLENGEAGLRFTGTVGNLDYGISYLYTRNPFPFIESFPIKNINVSSPSAEALLGQLAQAQLLDEDIIVTYERNQVIGAEVETTMGLFGIRGEAAYMTDQVFLKNDLTSTGKHILHYVLGIDRTFTDDWYANLQLYQRKIFSYDDRILFDHEFESGLFLRINKTLFHDKLRLNLDSFYNLTDNGFYLNPEVELRYVDNLSIFAGLNIFDGKADTFLGNYDRNDQGYLAVRFSF